MPCAMRHSYVLLWSPSEDFAILVGEVTPDAYYGVRPQCSVMSAQTAALL